MFLLPIPHGPLHTGFPPHHTTETGPTKVKDDLNSAISHDLLSILILSHQKHFSFFLLKFSSFSMLASRTVLPLIYLLPHRLLLSFFFADISSFHGPLLMRVSQSFALSTHTVMTLNISSVPKIPKLKSLVWIRIYISNCLFIIFS